MTNIPVGGVVPGPVTETQTFPLPVTAVPGVGFRIVPWRYAASIRSFAN